MQKIFKSIDFVILISFVLFWIFIISFLKDYHKIDKNKIPAFVIQEGKLSKQQIADLTKLDDAKNIWIISDKEDYNKATELIKQSADAISYANQIGRLDLVSMLLAVIAVIFGLAGIIGFLHIETVVKTKINEAIKEEFKEGGRVQEIIREETRKRFSNMEKNWDKDRWSEATEDDEKYYEELFSRTMEEFKN
jgi:cell division protein YceG involved in septum cleavage